MAGGYVGKGTRCMIVTDSESISLYLDDTYVVTIESDSVPYCVFEEDYRDSWELEDYLVHGIKLYAVCSDDLKVCSDDNY